MKKGLLFTALTLALSTPALATDYGTPMPAGDAVDLAVALAAPDAHDDAPGKFSGRIVEVCQKEGCWVMLESNGQVARVKAKDHGFTVPKDASGPAVVYGTLSQVELSEAQAKHLAEDAGRKGAVEPREFRIEATSIAIEAPAADGKAETAGATTTEAI